MYSHQWYSLRAHDWAVPEQPRTSPEVPNIAKGNGVELADYGNMMRRYWWLLVLALCLGGGGGYFISKNTAPVYRATTRLFVNQVQMAGLPSYGDLQTSERLTKTYSELLHSRPILDETIKRLNLPLTAEALDGKIGAQAIRDTQLLQLTVDDTDRNRATTIVNELAQVFVARMYDLQTGSIQAARDQVDRDIDETQRRIADTSNLLNQRQFRAAGDSTSNPTLAMEAQRLSNQLAQDQDRYRKLLEARQTTAMAQTQVLYSISVADPAIAPSGPVPPRSIENIVGGGLLGLLLAVGIGLLLNFFDDHIRDPEEVRERFNVVPLANVPYVRCGAPRVTADASTQNSESVQALRLLRTNLELATNRGASTIGITSALPNEGKSTIAANLAMIEAQAGKRVVLIDANLRDPNIHAIFGLPNDEGLSTLLGSEGQDADAAFRQGPHGLQILPGGPVPPNPAELLDSPQMTALIESLRTRADIIILDTAPVLPVSDTLILQRLIDGNVVVKDVQQTGAKVLGQAISALEHASGRVLGVVLNKVKRRDGSYGYKPQPVADTERKVG